MVELLAMKRIIVAAISEFFFQAAADFYVMVRGNSYIATVKQAVDIAAEQKAIINRVGARISIGFDVSGFEGRQSVLFSNCTRAAVGIRDSNLEGTLTEPRVDGRLFAVASMFFFDPLGLSIQVKDFALLPDVRKMLPDRAAGF